MNTYQIKMTVAAILLITCAAGITFQSHAQLAVGPGGAAAFDPQGVEIDPAGIMTMKKQAKGKQLMLMLRRAAMRKNNKTLTQADANGLVYISLPKIFAQAKVHFTAGTPLPDDIRFLKGMTKLQYIFTDPKNNDLIIAGPAEPYDTTITDRPIGKNTGRPVLQLDDLVVALRSTRRNNGIGCTINLEQKHMNAMVNALNAGRASVTRSPATSKRLTKKMEQAAGTQNVEYFGIPADSRFALVFIEADYIMKRLSLGLDRSPLRAVPSYLALQNEIDLQGNRFWFHLKYDQILTSPDELNYEIQGQSIQLSTVKRFSKKPLAPASPAARTFAQRTTKYYTQLSHYILAYADLANLADLSVAATIIHQQSLHKKANWNIDYIMQSTGYPVAKVKTPTAAKTICNYARRGRIITFVGGGVMLEPTKQIAKVIKKDTENKIKSTPAPLPEKKYFLTTDQNKSTQKTTTTK